MLFSALAACRVVRHHRRRLNPAHRFIVFDGNEGCGKSTQARRLKEHLEREGAGVLFVRDPGTTRVGELVRHILLDPANTDMAMRCEMLLYMAARAQMMRELVEPALAAGKIVLGDRFVSSTLAYQLGGDGLTAEQIRAVGEVAVGGRWPDLTLVLDMPVAASHRRVTAKFERKSRTLFGEETKIVSKDRIEERPPEYHEKVRQNYLAQVRHDPQRYRLIDADRPADAVHADVLRALSGG